MSDALNPRARAFLRSVQGGDDPTRADRERVRGRVKAQLAAGIAAGVAALATSKAAASTVPAVAAASTAVGATATATATTAASVAPGAIATAGSGFAIGKLATVLLIVGAVVGGTTAVVRHAQSDSAPGVPATASPAAARPPAVHRAPAPPMQLIQPPVIVVAPDPVVASAAAPDPPAAPAPLAPPRIERASANVPPVPLSGPVPLQTTPAAPSLDDEVSLVRDARAALRGGDAGQALALLDEHDRRFPGGALTEDCAAARVYALCSLGRTDAARALASRFLSEHPVSPHAASVRNSCGGAGGAN